MSNYGFYFSNPLINTGFVVVASGLSRGQWMPSYPEGFSYFGPAVNVAVAEVVSTTGEGTEGFLRLYPTLNHETVAPPSITDAETLYIGWNISEAGIAALTLNAPSLYKLSSVSLNGPLSFAVIGASGPDTCLDGYVWREAFSGDHVCVLPETRNQTAADNKLAASRVDPNGEFGPTSCVMGYVWRQARSDDHVCVTLGTRAEAVSDNAAAESRRL